MKVDDLKRLSDSAKKVVERDYGEPMTFLSIPIFPVSLDEMEALEKGAIEGPWKLVSSRAMYKIQPDIIRSICAYDDEGIPISSVEIDSINGEFIAASRDFVPWAIKRIRELEEIIMDMDFSKLEVGTYVQGMGRLTLEQDRINENKRG